MNLQALETAQKLYVACQEDLLQLDNKPPVVFAGVFVSPEHRMDKQYSDTREQFLKIMAKNLDHAHLREGEVVDYEVLKYLAIIWIQGLSTTIQQSLGQTSLNQYPL